jgi:hypothetical protein
VLYLFWCIFIRFGMFRKENLATLEKSFVAAISDHFSGCICTLQIVCSRTKVSKFPFEQESRKIAFAKKRIPKRILLSKINDGHQRDRTQIICTENRVARFFWYDIPKRRKIYPITTKFTYIIAIKVLAIKYTNIFPSNAYQNIPKLDFLVCKYTIGQPLLNTV